MSKVVILTDTVLNGEVGSPRYMGAYAIASALRREDISVSVVDYFTKIQNFFEFIDEILSEETVVLAISSTFLAPFKSISNVNKNRSKGVESFYKGELWFDQGSDLQDWLKILKSRMHRRNKDMLLVLGGVKSQFAIWRPEFYNEFDYVCIGSADKSFPAFVKQVLNKTEIQTKQILSSNRLIDNSLDLAEKCCPQADWSAEDAVQPSEALPIEISRGCVFNCKFCHYDKKLSFKKPIHELSEELIRNYERYGVSVYSFCDDCFNDHREKVEQYCELFLKLPFKIEWVAYARVDVAVRFPHTIDLMVEAGARGLYWGLESFHPVVARNAGKGTPTNLVKDFLLDFKRKYRGRCLSEGSFIVGLPGEDKASNLETLNWIIENDPLDLATFGALGLMPYISSLDKVLFDYADYSKNPSKYGFKEVRFSPHFWSHENMDSNEAHDIANLMSKIWREKCPKGFLRSIWLYPHSRSLGFNNAETMSAFTNTDRKDYFSEEIPSRFNQHLEKYHADILALHRMKNRLFE